MCLLIRMVSMMLLSMSPLHPPAQKQGNNSDHEQPMVMDPIPSDRNDDSTRGLSERPPSCNISSSAIM